MRGTRQTLRRIGGPIGALGVARGAPR